MSKRTRAEAFESSEEFQKEQIIQKLFSIKKEKEPKKLTYKNFPTLPIPEVNDRKLWVRKTHNKERQIEDFLKHTYFKYEAPIWAFIQIKEAYYYIKNGNRTYDAQEKILKNDYTWNNKTPNFEMLKAVQEGKGVKEYVKDFLSNKQIHKFLNSKYENIHQAMLDAYIPEETNRTLKAFIMSNTYYFRINIPHNNIQIRLLNYLIKHNVDADTAQEIYDYVRDRSYSRVGEIRDLDGEYIKAEDFFKRSLGTIIAASNDWHLLQLNLKNNKKVVWEKTIQDFETGLFTFKEITDNRTLSAEGNKMHHCVGSYAQRCVNGESRIISVKEDLVSVLTMEVDSKDRIIQIRGKYNRHMTPNENRHVIKFANERKLTIKI